MTDKMEALVKVRAESAGSEFQRVPVPDYGKDEVLIKVKVASICGTDVHIYKWNDWARTAFKVPRIYGHEYAGEVLAVGENVKGIKIGDFVSGEGHIACGTCFNCRTGKKHICYHLKCVGIDVSGAFAEYIVIPQENVWKNNPELPAELCSVQDPLGNAVHTVNSVDVRGKSVAIFGIGPIGAMTVSICRHSGAGKIFAIDYNNPQRCAMAKKLRADIIIDSAEVDPVKTILDATDNEGVDIVFEMSGAELALNNAFRILKPGGELSILGIYNKPVSLDINNSIVLKYITVRGIFGRIMFDTWYRMNELLKLTSFREDILSIITHKFRFSEFFDAMNVAASANAGRVVMKME